MNRIAFPCLVVIAVSFIQWPVAAQQGKDPKACRR